LAEAWLAVADGRTSEARTAFAQTEGTLVEAFSRRRVLAAILVAEGKADEGMAAARDGLALFMQEADHPFPGAAAMEREWLLELAEGKLPVVLTRTGAPA
jgi:ATP/maltotriose-dependent transcriptional regulator MalT